MFGLFGSPHLVKDFLQVDGPHAFGHVSVAGVHQEELFLGCHGSVDVLLPIDVGLTAVHHANVTCTDHSLLDHLGQVTVRPVPTDFNHRSLKRLTIRATQ